MREDLLQPSLGASDVLVAPPSTQAMFLTSFFGGPAAAVAVIAVASHRLRRLWLDLPLLLLLLIAPLALIAWVRLANSSAGFRAWLTDALGESGVTYLYRAMALLCFAIGYWMHREAHRNSNLVGLKHPNGWLVGIPCILFGYAFSVLAIMAIAAYASSAS